MGSGVGRSESTTHVGKVLTVAGVVVAAVVVLLWWQATPAAAATPEWVHQLGTAGYDSGSGIAVDASGNVYITGYTQGTLPGSPEANVGGEDVFVASYTAAGALRWVHQLGSVESDAGFALAVDAGANVYVTGYTRGTLPGSPEANAGIDDVFVASYDSTGSQRWVHQLGTTEFDRAYGVAVDTGGNVYVTGYTRGTLPGSTDPNAGLDDVFVATYTSTGTPRWVHQLGTTDIDVGLGVAVDTDANVYLTGMTTGTLPGSPEHILGIDDMFVASYDSTGTRRWVHQLGTDVTDCGVGIAVDADANVYVTGYTAGTLPGSAEPDAGGLDGFVAGYTSTGTRRWVHQLGSPGFDIPTAIAVDADANAYISGYTEGTLPASTEPNAGPFDVFAVSYSTTGGLRWANQLGTPAYDIGDAIAVDADANVYVTGYAKGTMPGSAEPGAGIEDVFVARWDAAAAADTITINVTGQVSYSNSATLTGGNVAVVRDANGVRTVGGAGTIPSTVSGNAQVAINVTRFWILPIHIGTVRVTDAAAGINLNHSVFFSRVNPIGPTGATNTQGWFDLTQWPWRTYTMTWTVQDLA